MPRMISYLAFLFICLVSSFASAEIYKTVDKNGKVTFSDTPPPNTNAKPIELKSLNTTPPPPAAPAYIPPNPRIDPLDYELHLLAPENGKTLLPDERSVTISVTLNRALQNEDILAYKLDGNLIIKTAELSYTLVEPPRGEHSVKVSVVDRDGNELAQSKAATFVVMRPLIKRTPPPVPKK
ncbi:hypothetical protein GCM10011613_34300 [Cellvibrio zantedeschiae]|uniref:DUF4124 domain-containing protein n=2 Tax=Cellvibrio zantedeschiae TaxID=1237077 RepID=A0ABQ3BCV8_9GAMM|nr:hypothetical protein GCM10011613_34300 [Cellvibrio zantedeschiae]